MIQGCQLYFLVDSGADISLDKGEKLLGTAEFELRDRVRVNTLRTGDANLRFYITTLQDG